MAAQGGENLVVVVGVDGRADDQIFGGQLFQPYAADVGGDLGLTAQIHQPQLVVDDLLNPAELFQLLLDLQLLLAQQLLQGLGAAVVDVAADLLERHPDFLQTPDSEKQVTLVFAVVAVAVFIGERGPKQPDFVVIEQGPLVGIA